MRLIFLSLFTLFYSLIPALSLATEYTVGKSTCEDFEYVENWYNNYDREGNYAHIEGKNATGLYGICLVLKGIASKDESTKQQGLNLLYRQTDKHSGINSVSAMFFLAQYIETGGAFNYEVDERNIDMAIRAYRRVLLFISIDKDYPWGGYSEDEKQDQIEIVSINMIPSLYHIKFEYGWIGSHNRYLQQSPSYEGDKASLKLYLEPNTDHAVLDPAYSDLNVITDSLHQMISSSQACIDLPYKSHYHRQDIYHFYQQRCRIFNRLGHALLPLEEKRQETLLDKSCSEDVLACDKYMDVYQQINSIIKDTKDELKTIPNPWTQ